MTTPTDPQTLIAQAREVCEAATPGPWHVDIEMPSAIQPIGALAELNVDDRTSEHD